MTPRRETVLNALCNIGEPPCTDCRLAAKCAAERMACAQFAAFVWSGSWRASQPRTPSKELFAQIYRPTDKPINNYPKKG